MAKENFKHDGPLDLIIRVLVEGIPLDQQNQKAIDIAFTMKFDPEYQAWLEAHRKKGKTKRDAS